MALGGSSASGWSYIDSHDLSPDRKTATPSRLGSKTEVWTKVLVIHIVQLPHYRDSPWRRVTDWPMTTLLYATYRL